MDHLQQLERKARLWHIEQATEKIVSHVDSERIWRIIVDDLPLLLREVRALLGPPPA